MENFPNIGQESTPSEPAATSRRIKICCVRDALLAGAAFFFLSAAASTILFQRSVSSTKGIFHRQIQEAGLYASTIIDPAVVARLASPEQNGSPERLALLAQLRKLQAAHSIIASLRVMRADAAGAVRQIVGASELPGSAVFSNPPAQFGDALKALRHGKSYETPIPGFLNGILVPLPGQPRDGSVNFLAIEQNGSVLADATASLRSSYHLALLVSLVLAWGGGLLIYFLRLHDLITRQKHPEEKEFFHRLTRVLPGMLYQAHISRLGETTITYASEGSRWVYELEPRDICKNPALPFERVHPNDREFLAAKKREVIKNPDRFQWREEFRVRLPKEGERWRFEVAHVEGLADGSSLWHGFVTDSTWRKETLEALRKSEASLRAAQQVSGMGSWELQLADLHDISANPLRWSDETYRVFGFLPHSVEVTCELFFSLVPPEEHQMIKDAVAGALTSKSRLSLDHRIIRPDGEVRHAHEEAVILCDEKTGRPAVLLGTVHDITEERRKEEIIRLSEERLNLATHAGRVGTWDYDVATKKIHWNDVMYEMRHLSPSAVDTNLQTSLQLLHPDDHERVMTEFHRCLEGNETHYEIECRVLLHDGDVLHTRSSATIIRDAQGRPLRVVGVEIDLTPEKKAVKAAQAADRAKSEFLAMMSHEIRTPMNGILGFTSLLQESPLNAEQHEYVETIERSGELLLALINDILDLSKIESGHIKLQFASFDIRPFLQEIFSLNMPRAREKNLDYQWKITPEAPALIETDSTRLGQILTNLLSNAVKFTEQGSVHLSVSARRDTDVSRWEWQFIVQDTGSGISEEARQHLFEPFYQADLSAARRHGGTGLGLSIARRLARHLGGDIVVESQPGQGSKFIATILAAEGQANRSENRTSASFKREKFHKKRVLIAEDNATSRRLATIQLMRLGFETETASDGFEAVEKYSSGAFHAILMDVQMPGMDGFEATRRIRQLGHDGVPIIALTANAMADDRQKCLDAGMNDYLSKPMRPDSLAETLDRWIQA